jgi:hypothetical protein
MPKSFTPHVQDSGPASGGEEFHPPKADKGSKGRKERATVAFVNGQLPATKLSSRTAARRGVAAKWR